VPETSQSRRVTRQPLQPDQARQIDFGLPPPGTRTFPRPGLPAAMSSTGAVPSGRHVSGGYTNRADRNHDLAGGGPASPGHVESAPFHRRTSGRVLPDSVELDEMTSRTTQHPSEGTDMCVLIAGSRRSVNQATPPWSRQPAAVGGHRAALKAVRSRRPAAKDGRRPHPSEDHSRSNGSAGRAADSALALTGKPSRGRANGTASAAWVGGAGWGRADWATAGDPGRG